MKNEAVLMEQIKMKALARRAGANDRAKLITRDMVFGEGSNVDAITLSELEEGYKTIALMIRHYGDIYLPIFIRLHKEIEAKRNSQMFKSLAMKVANDNGL